MDFRSDGVMECWSVGRGMVGWCFVIPRISQLRRSAIFIGSHAPILASSVGAT